MKRQIKETAASRTLCKKLEASGWQTWRLETRQASGVPDVIAADPEGKLVWIECKRARGKANGPPKMEKLRPAQVAFLARCVRDGVPCAVAVVGGTAHQLVTVNSLEHLREIAKGSSQ